MTLKSVREKCWVDCIRIVEDLCIRLLLETLPDLKVFNIRSFSVRRILLALHTVSCKLKSLLAYIHL